jgi:hydroxymethylpyrimidine kinase/phosphomethylpyrimidine kinase/thiamine-phosphate diphosphorylase
MYVNRGIRKAWDIDANTAKLFHGEWPEDEADLPWLSPTPLVKLPKPFKHLKTGLYPVVDSSAWVNDLVIQGVKCIQLRIKNANRGFLEQELKQSIAVCKQYGANLFVNDYWELAISLGADGIHLGQEDLQEADLDFIHQSGLYLGVSTHCYYEVARAHTLNPSYLAFGPIYPTTSKVMPFEAQGIKRLWRMRRTLNYPMVAIGGINLQRLANVLETGVEGIALISAICNASNPHGATQEFLKKIQESVHA